MKNVKLIQGRCAICRGPIDKEWAGEDPSLGTKCRTCAFKKPEPEVFGPKNVEIKVEKEIRFDPVLGVYEYHFDWAGTRIKVNGKVGVIVGPQADGDFVRFGDADRLSTFIRGVGYWDLLRIYKQIGGEVDPPPLDLPPHTPQKATLLDEPIVPVIVNTDRKRKMIHSIEVRVGRFNIPFLNSLHALTNLYVRYLFGLEPNYACEGGFIGKGFEVRNFLWSGVGINVRMNPLEQELKESRNIVAFLDEMLYQKEQAQPGVLKDASAYTVLTTWALMMATLLRYNWCEEKIETTEDVWRCYCRMQDILLNIMPLEELQKALDYASKNRLVHFGMSY